MISYIINGLVLLFLISVYYLKTNPNDISYISFIIKYKNGYNLLQIMYNLVLFSIIFYYYDFSQIGHNNLQMTPIEKNIFFAYLINKIFDLIDTFFIIVKEDWKRLSILHISHHILMVLICNYYYHTNLYKEILFVLLLNTFIHIIMYTYYMIPKQLYKYKKYITYCQFIQFILCLIHSVNIYYYTDLYIGAITEFIIACYMIIMFGNYFYRTHIRQKTKI